MNYVNKILEVLGIQPLEKFTLIGYPACEDDNYYFDSKLNIYGVSNNKITYTSNVSIQDILTGVVKIVKKPTKKEQLAIDYARACGCKWMVKDKNGGVYAYKLKPYKYNSAWKESSQDYITIDIPLSFLSWSDEEPYFIGD